MLRPGIDSPISEAPDHPCLKVRRTGETTKERKAYAISGVSPGYNFRSYNNTITGIERALKERLIYIPDPTYQFVIPPDPPIETFKAKYKVFTYHLDRLSTFSHPLDTAEYAECFKGRKRERYLIASQELQLRNINARDADRKVFMKYEYYNFDAKKDPVCRAICPGSDIYLVETGRYLKPIEKKVYRAVNSVMGHTSIMKGKNQSERGAIISDHWNQFERPVCVSMDASRFEQSVKRGALTWEHERYAKYFPGDKHFKKIMRYQLVNKGRTRAPDGNAKFELGPIRSSGDVNTAMGNCLISAASIYAFLLEHGVSNYRTIIDGDDLAVILDERDLGKLAAAREWYKGIGFRMKIEEPAYEIEHIDFCQSRPVWTPDGYIMIRNVLDALSKDSISKKNITDKTTYCRWMAAVGKGGISLNGGIPIAQSFYQMYDRLSNGAAPLPDVWDPYHMSHKFRGMERCLTSIDDRTRLSFFIAFGIAPEEQEAIELYYQELSLCSDLQERGTAEEIPSLPWGRAMPTSRGQLLD